MVNTCFPSLIGNEKLKKMLSADLKNKTQNHAYIIEGPLGSGKKTLAREMAKALLCSGTENEFPCGVCASCKKINSGFCTDIYTLSRGEAAGISVEAVRKMTDTVSYPPDDGDYKVYIIEDAGKMTVQAQNAFLLSLEEPPAYVMYLLLCEDASLLLETIRSRAPVIKTELFQNKFISDWLRTRPEAAKVSEGDIAAACVVSGGSLGIALDCISGREKTRASLATEAAEAVLTLCTKSLADRILFFMSLKHSREEFGILLDYAMLAVRDLTAVKSGASETVFYPDQDSALDISSKLKMRRLIKLFEVLEVAKKDITQSNASASAVMCSLAAAD